jgi:hypothetical protein
MDTIGRQRQIAAAEAWALIHYPAPAKAAFATKDSSW